MKPAMVVAITLVTAALILWVREGATFPIVHVLPFCGGHAPGIYDLAAVIMLGITLWGIWRLFRTRKS